MKVTFHPSHTLDIKMAPEPITLLNEYRRLLGVNKASVFDWGLDPEIGFFKSHGQYLWDFDVYRQLKRINGDNDCTINYMHSLSSMIGIIRFPDIALLSIIGMIIGFLGLIKFSRFGRHCAKLVFSFTFFMMMNISGFLFHCTLPVSSQFRIICALIDQASTGVSGMFLAMEMYSLYKQRDCFPFNLKQYLLFVWITFTFSNVPLIGELIYLIGCASVLSVSLYILINDWLTGFGAASISLQTSSKDGVDVGQRKNPLVMRMSRCGFLAFAILAVSIVFTSNLCQWTGSYVNLMSVVFGISDMGFGFVLIYGMRYYENENKIKDKKE